MMFDDMFVGMRPGTSEDAWRSKDQQGQKRDDFDDGMEFHDEFGSQQPGIY